MSIPNLPVNFKDDILAASNPKRKYQQTFNSDGSVSLEDVTSYSQQGSDFGASQINQTNKAINNIYTERILTLDELELVTEPGFFVDAEAVKEAYDELNGKTLSYKQIYEGYSGGGYADIPSIAGAQLVCIECVYANVTRGATTIPIEQFKKGYDCYATYGRDSNIWALAKYVSDTRVGINCGGSGGDVLCRISIL